MSTSKEQRHQAILERLRGEGSSSVAALGAFLGVAEMTIRRDLEALEADGALIRFHGGAKLALGSSYEPPFAVRERLNMPRKREIARAVAAGIEDGETIILDGGSTGVAIAEAIIGRHVTVCPLSLRVAWVFARSTTVSLMLPSGTARTGELSLSGPDTSDFLHRHHFDRYVMTASAFSLSQGFTEWNTDDAAVKRASLDSAGLITAAVDSAKFGQVAFVHICDIAAPDEVVVDSGLEELPREQLRKAARRVTVAASDTQK